MTLAKCSIFKISTVLKYLSPYKECCSYQQYGQVHCNCCLKVELLEESGGICHQQQKEGGEGGGQQLVG